MVMLKEKLRSEKGALAKATSVRSGAQKLNLVVASIRGKGAATALTQLRFEKRRVAREVGKVLQAAIANAENNHNLDVDRLYVAEAWVGRAFVMKRFHARGRGKSSGIEKPFSHLTIVVKERAGDAPKMTAKRAKGFSKTKPEAKQQPAVRAASGA